MSKVSPFVLCGGAGTRLWPLSREAFPKQFHKFTGSRSLFQETCHRFSADLFEPLRVLSNHQYRFLVAEQLEELGAHASEIVLEPASRNTAPAACIAALFAAKIDPAALLLLAPSDHHIAQVESFVNSVACGVAAANEGELVVFGVEPDCPHTGYGYIEIDRSNALDQRIRSFVEKPSSALAETYFDSGQYLWNAGIFLFTAATMLELVERHAPDILQCCQRALQEAKEDLGFLRLGPSYASAPAISLDYAIAEKAERIRCVRLQGGWSDVGSWSSVWNLMNKDAGGNVVHGEGEVLLADTRNSYAYSDNSCVALVGVENVVVVVTEDAVLVTSKAHAESVRGVVERMNANGGMRVLDRHRVYRPWGWYQTLNRGDRYQVKCIMVKPGGKLSLQSHYHRSEHWVVVKGTLEVTQGNQVELLSENESTFIPIGKQHRLANPGKIPAFLIEVQSGSYLGEDDIVRFEDLYGRAADG